MSWHPEELKIGTRLELLNLHYMEYLESLDDNVFVRVIEDWIVQNRPYCRGYWLDSWNSYAVSIRCVVWMQQYAIRKERLAEQFRIMLLAAIREQVRFLVRNLEFDIGGNHLIKNIKALLWAGRFFDSPQARKWERLGRKLLVREVGTQILADGMHYERSPAYHCQVFADLLDCFVVLRPCPERTALEDALGRMAQAMVQLTHPDGFISLFNDGGLHMSYQPAECLAVYADQIKPPPEPACRIHLPDAGYFGIRSNTNFFLADCGMTAPKFLPAHGHGDILSFEWDVAGERIFVDAGVMEYHPGKWREYSRSTLAHNTVSIADTDQCEFYNAFRVGRKASACLQQCVFRDNEMILKGSHNGFRHLAGSPLHERCIRTDALQVDVRDRVSAGRGQRVCARLLCHPSCRLTVDDSSIVISINQVGIVLKTQNHFHIEQGWWMPDFGVCSATSQIVIEYGAAPCEGSFLLLVR